MGRGRVELKLIENKINRQVTFAKRRNGLLKKAHELSVLCDAEVAVILFSSRGRLFDFCSSSSVMKMVQRYQKYSSYDGGKAVISSIEPQNAYQEYLKLKTRAEYLQSSQSNLLGEDLEPLNIKELTGLEDQIEMSLRHIRQTKNQGIVDQLTDLKRKEQMLFDSNKTLQKKLQELNEANMLQLEWQSGGSSSASKPQLENFSQPLGFPPLQPGISPPSRNPSSSEAMTKSTVAGFAAGWIWEAL